MNKLIAIALVLVLWSCKKDDPEPVPPAPKPITEAQTSFKIYNKYGFQVKIDYKDGSAPDTTHLTQGETSKFYNLKCTKQTVNIWVEHIGHIKGDTAVARVYIDSGHKKYSFSDSVEIIKSVTLW